MTQHTPGPWKADLVDSDSGPYWVIEDQYGDTARVIGPVKDAETIANARLIAAAPDMLDDHWANRDDAAGAYQALNDGRTDDAFALLAAVSRRSEVAIAKAEHE